jgi:hypothetical protein
MKFLLLSTFLILEIFCAKNLQKSENENFVFIKSIECHFSDEFIETIIYPNASCSVNILNRKVSAVNFYMALRKPLTKLFVSFCEIFNEC